MLNRAKWSSLGIVTLSVLALFVWVQPAEARGRGRGRGMGMGQGRGAGYGLAALNLSSQQQEKIAQLRADFVKQTADARAKLDVKRAELRALWMAEEPDGKAIKAKQAEMDGLRSQLRQARVDQRLAVRAVLTPEQRAKFKGCRGLGYGKGDGFGRHHRRGGRGMGRGMGGGGMGGGWGGGY